MDPSVDVLPKHLLALSNLFKESPEISYSQASIAIVDLGHHEALVTHTDGVSNVKVIQVKRKLSETR